MSEQPLFPLGFDPALSRRKFIVGSASLAAAILATSRAHGVVAGRPKLSGYPFRLGIASGDPTSDGVVLWTRLVPEPAEPAGGMPAEPVQVKWEIAADEGMKRIVRSGTTVASPAWAHSVHVEADGLKPDRWYWYRFHAAGETSPVGRTRTMPAAGSVPKRLRFAFASCQKYDSGYYTAYEHMAREDIDLVFHLGDYIYEKADAKDAVRRHGLPMSITVDQYRVRYAAYKSDLALQAMHALVPWIVTWDDHEVTNDYAGPYIKLNETAMERDTFLKRRAAAYQAYYEHMPLRRAALPAGPDMLLYRRLEFGRLASFHVLDTRQYRSHWLYNGKKDHAFEQGMLDPSRTIMGAQQRDWLRSGLLNSTGGWNVLAQQVMMARIDEDRGPGQEYMMDKWTGFEFERRRTLDFLREKKIKNPVVITGDIHSSWANELIEDFDNLDSAPVGVEFAGTSITSGGDREDSPDKQEEFYDDNPFVKFYDNRRGYVSCDVTPKEWRTMYRRVPFVTRRGAPLETPATFVVESGVPKLNRT